MTRQRFVRALLAAAGLLALGAATLWGAAQPPKKIPPRELKAGEQFTVYRLEIHEDIVSSHVPFFIHRGVVAAKAAGADAVVLDLNTNGGELGLMMEIRDALIALPMLTYTYVNGKAWSAGALLAVTMDKIVMAPVSSIGASQVIAVTGQEIPRVVEQKINSALKAEIRSTAKYKGHPVLICEAFIDRDIEIPGLTPKGEVLTLDQEQATTQTTYVDPQTSQSVTLAPLAAFIARDLNDLLEHEGIWPARILSYQMSWSEQLAKWLMSVKALLLLVGLAALFIEAKTPGVGVPGAVGVLALALFFWGSYLADLASFLDIALFVVGVVLLLLEIFVIPGFGITGVTGILLILLSLVLAMFKLPPADVPDLGWNMQLLTRALLTLIGVFAGILVILPILAKLLPSAPLFRQLILAPEQTAEAAAREVGETRGLRLEQRAPPEQLLGATGVALTDLRPAGLALVAGKRLDVLTEGDYISAGSPVRVTDIHGNVYTVAAEPGGGTKV